MSDNDTSQKQTNLINILKKNISLSAFIIMFLLFSLTLGTRFLNYDNLQTIIEQSIVLLIVSFGVTFVILSGGNDLSVGSIVGFSGVISASYLKQPIA